MKTLLLFLLTLTVPAGFAMAQTTDAIPADATETVDGVTLWLSPPEVPETALALCDACGGTGEVNYADASRFREELAEKPPVRVRCRRCGGTGRARRKLTPDERIEVARRLRMEFVQRQLAVGHVPIGDVYTENGVTDALDPMDFAKLAHRHPKVCEACFGLKVVSCRGCHGLGYEEERERTERTKATHTRIGSIRHNKPGDAPEGSDEDYHVVRVACDRCGGTGASPCRKCKGSGLAPLCRRCEGVGFAQDKRTTDDAGRPLMIRCKSCKGTGRR